MALVRRAYVLRTFIIASIAACTYMSYKLYVITHKCKDHDNTSYINVKNILNNILISVVWLSAWTIASMQTTI